MCKAMSYRAVWNIAQKCHDSRYERGEMRNQFNNSATQPFLSECIEYLHTYWPFPREKDDRFLHGRIVTQSLSI
jgi:hypothetical protein